jgi:competence protein ComGC
MAAASPTLAPAPKNRSGQLIELLVVLVILGVLSAIAIEGLAQVKDQASRVACQADIKATESAVELYRVRHETYPANVAALRSEGYLVGGESSDYIVTYQPSRDGLTYSLSGTMQDGALCATSGSGS